MAWLLSSAHDSPPDVGNVSQQPDKVGLSGPIETQLPVTLNVQALQRHFKSHVG